VTVVSMSFLVCGSLSMDVCSSLGLRTCVRLFARCDIMLIGELLVQLRDPFQPVGGMVNWHLSCACLMSLVFIVFRC